MSYNVWLSAARAIVVPASLIQSRWRRITRLSIHQELISPDLSLTGEKYLQAWNVLCFPFHLVLKALCVSVFLQRLCARYCYPAAVLTVIYL